MGSTTGFNKGRQKSNGTSTTTPNVPSQFSQPWQQYATDVAGLGNVQSSGPTGFQQATFAKAPGLLNDIDISKFYNPYENDVINAGVGDLDRARQRSIVGNSASATAQGGSNAWLGDRAGVADSETNRGYLDSVASMVAGLRSTGYNTAADLAFRDSQNTRENLSMAADFGERERQLTDPYQIALRQLAERAGLLGAIPIGDLSGSTTVENGTNSSSGFGIGGSWQPK